MGAIDNQSCHNDDPKEKCWDEPRQECCNIPMEECRDVPREYTDYITLQECASDLQTCSLCKDVSEQVYKLVTWQKFNSKPREVCCDVPYEICNDVSRKQCTQVPVQDCKQVPRL